MYSGPSLLQKAHKNLFLAGIFCTSSVLVSFTVLGYAEEKRLKKLKEKYSWNLAQRIFPTITTEQNTFHFQNRLLWELEHSWISLPTSHKTLASLIAINIIVFMGWKVPSLRPVMEKHFLTSPFSYPHTILTSAFSHSSFLHLSFNMLALYSFGGWIHEKLGREQFLFMYLSSAMISSLASQAWKVLIGGKSMLYTSSLGASGAIFSLVGTTGHRSDMSVGVIFIPGVHIPAPMAVAGMAGVDAYFLLFKNAKSIFDHAAHLGGSGFGYLYYAYGPTYIWSKKKKLLDFINV